MVASPKIIYDFHVLVARTVSYSFAALTHEILFLSREHKIRIFELMCNVLFIISRKQMNLFKVPAVFILHKGSPMANIKMMQVYIIQPMAIFFVLTFPCSSEKDFTTSSENLTNLLLAIFDFLHKQP